MANAEVPGWQEKHQDITCSWCKKPLRLSWRMKDDGSECAAIAGSGSKLANIGTYARKVTVSCAHCSTVNETSFNLKRPD